MKAGLPGEPRPRLLVATGNRGKVAEIRRILAVHLAEVEVLGLADVEEYAEPVEDQPTFAGNALLKARAGVAATGLPTLADDSGLCVDALNGMPGVLSARWAGPPKSDERNNRLLLDQLADVPDERRGARFECAVAFSRPQPGNPADGSDDLIVHGQMTGRLIRECRGGGGFGYDVLFEADDRPGRTTAELDPADKDAISHRGRALRAIAPQVAGLLTAGR